MMAAMSAAQAVANLGITIVIVGPRVRRGGFGLSPHLFNTEADIDRALAGIRTELG
jgi:hypothetical protein